MKPMLLLFNFFKLRITFLKVEYSYNQRWCGFKLFDWDFARQWQPRSAYEWIAAVADRLGDTNDEKRSIRTLIACACLALILLSVVSITTKMFL